MRCAGSHGRTVVIEQCGIGRQRAPQLLASGFGREVIRGDHLKPGSFGKSLRTGGDEQHVSAPFHDSACRTNRVADAADASDGAGAQTGAVHDRGVEFVRLVMRENRAVPSVEQWAIFQHRHCQRDGVECAAAVGEQALGGEKNVAQRRVVTLFLFAADARAAQRACAAVDGDDRDGGRCRHDFPGAALVGVRFFLPLPAAVVTLGRKAVLALP